MPEELKIKHCKEALDRETIIGSGVAQDGKTKRFSFNTWANSYSIFHGDVWVDGGQAIEELLNEYNAL